MNASNLVRLFDTLFKVSLGLCLLGLVLAVLFFFLYRIPEVFYRLTGRGKKPSAGRHLPEKDRPAKPAEVKPAEVKPAERKPAEVRPVQAGPGGNDPPRQPAERGQERKTEILSRRNGPPSPAPVPAPAGPFEVFETVLLVHTDEII